MTKAKMAVGADVADRSARVITNELVVAERVQRNLGWWWHAGVEPLGAGNADVTVNANVDPALVEDVASAVDVVARETISYAGKKMRVARTGGAVIAYSADGVACTVSDGSIEIAGTEPGPVDVAACRLTREAVRGALARDGWVLLRAAAVVRDGRAYLACGAPGSGTTAAALQLAGVVGGAVLATDRVLVRADADGAVVVLPWPSAAEVGLGLLDSAGWFGAVAAARDDLHSSTSAEVLDALARADRDPVLDGDQELKVRLYPDQITSLLGLPLATSAEAGTLLFPTVDPAAGASVEPGGRAVGVDDTVFGTEEDRYVDVFGLRDVENDAARDAVLAALNALPRWAVTLTHDTGSTLAALGEICR